VGQSEPESESDDSEPDWDEPPSAETNTIPADLELSNDTAERLWKEMNFGGQPAVD
jgi:hypothetical protein